MRTHRFTFKKTKRVKVVTEHHALSVDLTEEDAAILECALIEHACRPPNVKEPPVLTELREALAKFLDQSEPF